MPLPPQLVPTTDAAYRHVLRPALFHVRGGDAEAAHHLTLASLQRLGASAPGRLALRQLVRPPAAPTVVAGINFPGVVGLAAGVDKDGVAARAWPALGFGFVELGTVTARPQPGNPTPRLFRLRASRAIINRMGFNNAGAPALAERLRGTGAVGIPVGVSIGKTKVTPVEEATEDYLVSVRALDDLADYVAVNVSSPNTPGLRSLQDAGPLRELLAAVTEASTAPVFVKLAPDLTDAAIGEALQVCADTGVRGVIATNTTLARDRVALRDAVLAQQAGGLSGAPLTVRARQVVRFVARHSDLPVIGVGGIMTVADGLAMLEAGAVLLQLYSGFVYGGPGLVSGLNAATRSRRAGV
ncbi:MAG TPA: quinone-dependent dihydroorotate dehydrogenase [Segeticoccus sp.]|uniref:quinone-dependent dihydroorotate dehydrogenase n=1 Tax=Segeticoccus sp. TaxID=2706531 RepID=UPI002D7FB041|nr:quinone-dependent dihydroorotate dehydrogenase [Segeticoccus sp.]HET8600923.1 quinone-dependent dihydroorotate dehydrogenase [Segeticoccus sp.]